MQVRVPRRGVMVAALAAIALAAPATAWGDVKAIADANDRPGPLDIRAARHAHAGTRVVHEIVTFANWRAGLLGQNTPNLFALEIDTTGDNRPERIVLIFSAGGRMVAGVFTRSGSFVGTAAASHPNGHLVRVSIARARLGNPAGYRWTAFSFFKGAGCGGGCTDRAPNVGRVRHDITAPKITFPLLGVPAGEDYDVTFTVSDTGGSGLASWRLQRRALGATTWTLEKSGMTTGLQSVPIVAVQGDNDEFRLVAKDRQGNLTVSPIRLISVPFDDVLFAYSTGWTALTAQTGAFLATLHTVGDSGALETATYGPFQGTRFSIVAPTGPAWPSSSGLVLLDGTFLGSYNPGDRPAGVRRIVFTRAVDPSVPHTVEIQRAGGVLPLDGIIIR